MMRPMKYLLAHLLPKEFHSLTCIVHLSYTYNSNEQRLLANTQPVGSLSRVITKGGLSYDKTNTATIKYH